MKARIIGVVLGLAGFALTAIASGEQHEPPASGQPAHHACFAQDQQALERGEGFGMALAADRHGFPGPKHILELRERLELTPVQEEQVRRLFDRMQTRALEVGKQVLEREAELERLFASGSVDPLALQLLLNDIASLRAELRWVHLAAHLEARELLTSEQRARYQAFRHPSPP